MKILEMLFEPEEEKNRILKERAKRKERENSIAKKVEDEWTWIHQELSPLYHFEFSFNPSYDFQGYILPFLPIKHCYMMTCKEEGILPGGKDNPYQSRMSFDRIDQEILDEIIPNCLKGDYQTKEIKAQNRKRELLEKKAGAKGIEEWKKINLKLQDKYVRRGKVQDYLTYVVPFLPLYLSEVLERPIS
ncbi:MAG TPA: hypothetical protein PLK34_00520 [Candidatus Pacearchaeota archaeon]|nr:hypothetical protein [Candidatus Pacearchaeota archaeon]